MKRIERQPPRLLRPGEAVPAGSAVNMSGEIVSLDSPAGRAAAKMFNVPDVVVGIPTPWRRRLIQRFTRR